MKKFMALYMMPMQGLEEWMKLPAEERKAQEDAMQKEWQVWADANKSMLVGTTAGVGKTKRVTKEGIQDTKNDIMLYSVVEAETHEDAVKIFEDHPHFGIPNAWIDVMPINPLPGMDKGN